MDTRLRSIVVFQFILANFLPRNFLAKADSFASISQLQEIVNLETKLSESLETFVKLEKNRLDKIKNFAENVKEATELVKRNGVSYPLENPMTSYALIKRFANGWSELSEFLNRDYSQDLQDLLESNEGQFPNYADDLVGAMAALFRLQDTYNISTVDMVNNNIPGCGPAPRLLAEDCFHLGVLAYQAGRYGQGLDWLRMADQLTRQGKHGGEVNYTEVLEHLAWVEFIKGNPERSLNITLEIVKMAPHSKKAKDNVMHYKRTIEQGTGETYEQINAKQEAINTAEFTRGEYARLCRGDTSQSTPQGNLICWYQGRKNPMLLLRPIKVEMVWRKPRLFVFRDFVSSREAEQIKAVATPKLKRATVFNKQTGELENADYRVSKSAWLENTDDELIAKVNRRIGAVTGLDMSTAEPLQIANYGMAGQYEYHLDFGDPGSPLDISPNGNRIATVLIYLNDVSRGGYTVFTRAKTFVSPTMGDAVFWYNLKRSGKGDYETEHAACPVLCGNKWVANKWLHIRGQEFRRKCSRNSDL
ncbi:prolyl 4-hydroxylase subunit alpha-1-like [Montipora foliosa]|uniref:prolyl 4-hydroxylase subunit alpha-1-like n=1 Tax=Montipora foliosa TaxID=591990 RepID=UPI0035F1B9A1